MGKGSGKNVLYCSWCVFVDWRVGRSNLATFCDGNQSLIFGDVVPILRTWTHDKNPLVWHHTQKRLCIAHQCGISWGIDNTPSFFSSCATNIARNRFHSTWGQTPPRSITKQKNVNLNKNQTGEEGITDTGQREARIEYIVNVQEVSFKIQRLCGRIGRRLPQYVLLLCIRHPPSAIHKPYEVLIYTHTLLGPPPSPFFSKFHSQKTADHLRSRRARVFVLGLARPRPTH